jgi:hypothetical protein
MNCRFWLLLSIIFTIVSRSNAQLHLALRAGPQIGFASYRSSGTNIGTGTVPGFNAGLMGKVYFDNKAAFVTGIYYNRKGYTVRATPTDPVKTYQLNYIEIPVMVQFDLSAKPAHGFYCKIGPSVGAGLNGKEHYSNPDGSTVRNIAVLSVTGNHFGLFDAALNAGFGFIQKGKFFTELEFAYGIGNINNDVNGPAIKTRLASLTLGYFIK